MRASGNVVVITGGGSGIGEALAHRFHDSGNAVVIGGPDVDRLHNAARGRRSIHPLYLDVDDVDSIESFAMHTIELHPSANVLINNAGIFRHESLVERRDLRDAEAIIRTNLLGMVRTCNAFVDHLVAQAGATIVNNTSGLAFVPLISAPTYSAVKAAIHSYTVSLRLALRNRVDVIELAPPALRTDIVPGQKDREEFLPLDTYIEEAFGMLLEDPHPDEVLVERVRRLRFAERDGRFGSEVMQLNHLPLEKPGHP